MAKMSESEIMRLAPASAYGLPALSGRKVSVVREEGRCLAVYFEDGCELHIPLSDRGGWVIAQPSGRSHGDAARRLKAA